MNFSNEKKQCLEKSDKSKKQSVDIRIREIVDFINSLEDYYTTSSCSGRILVIENLESRKKNEAEWLFASHEKASVQDIKNALASPSRNSAWLKQEGFILHICCRTLDAADKIISLARDCGLKRSGAISFSKRIIVEILGTDRIEAVLARHGAVIASDSYIEAAAEEANLKMEKNFERLILFFDALKRRALNNAGNAPKDL